MGEQRYVTFMASLPYHGRLFGARQTPLSRFQLNKRLAWLDPADAETLGQIEDLLRWRRLLLAETDEGFLKRANEVVDGLDSELLQNVVRGRLEGRTLIAALRMRRLGYGSPRRGQPWGYGRWVDVIRRRWSDPGFGLERVYPWVGDAEQKLADGDSVAVERLFMGWAWDELARHGAGHYFDFEAVAIYVLRWDLIDRWTHYDGEAARTRILTLVDAGLGKAGRMFA